MADSAAPETDPTPPHPSASSNGNHHNDADNDDGASDATEFLMTYLTSTRKIDVLHSTLFNSLARTGWTQRVRSLASELIRSRTCTRFEQIVDRILEEAAAPPSEDTAHENGIGEVGGKAENGVNGSTQNRKRKREGESATNGTGASTGPNKKKTKHGNSNNNKNQTASNNSTASTTTTNGHPEPASSKPSSATTIPNADSYYDLDIDVRIPPTVVSQGARFLRDTLNDIYYWGGVEGDHEHFLTNGRSSGTEDGDGDLDADLDADADAGNNHSTTGKSNGVVDATKRAAASDTAAKSDTDTAETDETKKPKKGKEKEGVGDKT